MKCRVIQGVTYSNYEDFKAKCYIILKAEKGVSMR